MERPKLDSRGDEIKQFRYSFRHTLLVTRCTPLSLQRLRHPEWMAHKSAYRALGSRRWCGARFRSMSGDPGRGSSPLIRIEKCLETSRLKVPRRRRAGYPAEQGKRPGNSSRLNHLVKSSAATFGTDRPASSQPARFWLARVGSVELDLLPSIGPDLLKATPLSSEHSSKSGMSRFSTIRAGFVDFGITERFCVSPSGAEPWLLSGRVLWQSRR